MTSELNVELEQLVTRQFDDPGPTVSQAGELDLLRRLKEGARGTAGPGLELGPGDDAALYRIPAGRELVITQDALVEGVDFQRRWITPYGLGRRAFQVALSDIAGMGARPEFCLATLCAARSTRRDDILAIQRGLAADAVAAGCSLAGGDLSDIDGPLVIDVVVGGSVEPGAALRADCAHAGDLVVVTGHLGRAAAGLRGLRAQADESAASVVELWREAQLAPRARINEGQALVSGGVRCGTDISDGVVVSAATIARESHCGIELWLDTLPVDSELKGLAQWQELALAGGEDFELLAAMPPSRVERLRHQWPAGLEPLSVIGEIVAGSGVELLEGRGGDRLALPSGYQQF